MEIVENLSEPKYAQSGLLFFGYIVGNPSPSLYSLILLTLNYPLFRLKNRQS